MEIKEDDGFYDDLSSVEDHQTTKLKDTVTFDHLMPEKQRN